MLMEKRKYVKVGKNHVGIISSENILDEEKNNNGERIERNDNLYKFGSLDRKGKQTTLSTWIKRN